ncbi:MarR family transcriptional regulator, partial [Loktanella sp. TSTF-M6]
ELARALGVERSGMVALIDELESADLIRRDPVPGDRRVQALQPTDRGIARFDALVALVRAHEARCFAGLDDTEKDTLLHLLHKVRTGGNST